MFFAPLKNAPNGFNTKTLRVWRVRSNHYSTTATFLEHTKRYIVKLNRIGTINVAKTAKQSLIVTVSKDRNINTVARDSIARLQKVRGMVDVSPDYKVDIRPPDAPILWRSFASFLLARIGYNPRSKWR